MKDEHNDIDILIARVASGEASSAERSQLEEWAERSADNRRYSDQMILIYRMAGSPTARETFDADQAWVRMKSRMGSRPAFSPYRIAATVAVLITLSVLLFRFWSREDAPYQLASGKETVLDTLPDGSTAFLNRRSSIELRRGRDGKRHVKLSGEAFFQVKHDERAPFQIEIGSLIIQDIGTAFNVEAWPGKDSVLVTVTEGEVVLIDSLQHSLSLRAGQAGGYIQATSVFFTLEQPDNNALSYQSGVLVFDNTPLQTVIDQVNEEYESAIELAQGIRNCRITVTFRNESLENVVDVIAETLHLQIVKEGSRIRLEGTACQ